MKVLSYDWNHRKDSNGFYFVRGHGNLTSGLAYRMGRDITLHHGPNNYVVKRYQNCGDRFVALIKEERI